jgi:hypothetical protein
MRLPWLLTFNHLMNYNTNNDIVVAVITSDSDI